MAAAQRHVAIVPANLYLGPSGDHVAGHILTHHHGRLATAEADGFYFFKVVRPGQQILAAFEGFALEVRAQTVGQHWNVELVRHLAELEHLVSGQELGLIDQHTVNVQFLTGYRNQPQQVGVAIKGLGGRFQTNPGGDLARAVAIIQFRRQHDGIHTPLAIVVAGLEQGRGFARIHGRVVEVQLSHRSCRSVDLWLDIIARITTRGSPCHAR